MKVSHGLLVLSRMSLISALLPVRACVVSVALCCPHVACTAPTPALPASYRFHVFPRNSCPTRRTHGSFPLLACALPLAPPVSSALQASLERLGLTNVAASPETVDRLSKKMNASTKQVRARGVDACSAGRGPAFLCSGSTRRHDTVESCRCCRRPRRPNRSFCCVKQALIDLGRPAGTPFTAAR